MKIGFTGTSRGLGMNEKQRREFVELILMLRPTEFHHGDCVKSDEQAHHLVREHLPKCYIVVHPPEITTKRAFCNGDDVLPEKGYLERDVDIVLAVDRMIATSNTDHETKRGGTWYTIRQARMANRSINILYPTIDSVKEMS